MWQKKPVYELYPTLTNTGKQIYKKRLIKNPSDIECWFSFARYNDLDGLQRMINRKFNVNSYDINGQTIGILACHIKSPLVLKFYLQNKGNIAIGDNLSDNIFHLVCSHHLSSSFFKLVWTEHYLINRSLEEWSHLFLHDNSINSLLSYDSNLPKIKYLFKFIPNNMHKALKGKILMYLFGHINNLNNSKILFYFQDKEFLKKKLASELHTKPSIFIKKNKI